MKRNLTLPEWSAAVAVLVFVADQLSKWWILKIVELPARGQIEVLPFFDLSMVWNRGVSFGMFQAGSPVGRAVLVVFSLAVVGFLVKWALDAERRIQAVFLGMIIGGALGNALDRVRYGAVVDFLDFTGLHFKWVFNIADSAISIGVALLVFDAFFAKQDTEKGEHSG